MRWWGKTFVWKDAQGREERIIVIRLWWWGFGYSVNCDDFRWGQRVLMYRGRGSRPGWLSLSWYFPPETIRANS